MVNSTFSARLGFCFVSLQVPAHWASPAKSRQGGDSVRWQDIERR